MERIFNASRYLDSGSISRASVVPEGVFQASGVREDVEIDQIRLFVVAKHIVPSIFSLRTQNEKMNRFLSKSRASNSDIVSCVSGGADDLYSGSIWARRGNEIPSTISTTALLADSKTLVVVTQAFLKAVMACIFASL